MRVFINGLSVDNQSGRHVLLGHMGRLAQWTVGTHEYYFLYHEGNSDIARDMGSNVQWIKCPSACRNWLSRSAWELASLPGLLKKRQAEMYFTPTGTGNPFITVPQVIFAQNPLCLVRELHRKPRERIKAIIQRQAYRSAMRVAALMIFNSEYMRRAYESNAGFAARLSRIVYQAVSDETHAAAAKFDGQPIRKPMQILSVSAMAPHKGVETTVRALALLHQECHLPATLRLVGGWPDAAYERRIRNLVADLGLSKAVSFEGHVSQDELHRAYAESAVYCLMSSCESFGIPAVEAQAFGTPVVSSNCCAIPEVCGLGGLYPEPGDAPATAKALASILTQESTWSQLSGQARKNASKYRWDICSRPMLEMFNLVPAPAQK